jgi:hypothetical protein
VAAGRTRKGDTELLHALACGASVENAAQKAGLSRRTAYRRLEDPAFRARVIELRAELTRRALGMLTAAGLGAVKTLTVLQESATSEAVRLGAARATLELGCKLRENSEWSERLTTLEALLESLLQEADPPSATDGTGGTTAAGCATRRHDTIRRDHDQTSALPDGSPGASAGSNPAP